MHPIALLAIALGNITVSVIAWRYFKRFQKAVSDHELEMVKRERELKRRVLELQVLRSLGERAGYSLNLQEILEVITDSLGGLVEFSTNAYMLLQKEGKILFKIHANEPVSRVFLETTKSQMLQALSAMSQQNLQSSLTSEIASGGVIDDTSEVKVGSFFNLPVVISGRVVALVNISSTKVGLYGDEETAILYTIFTQVSSQATKLAQVVENEKRRLSAMISSFTDGVVMVDTHFNILVTNPALPQLLGLPKEVSNLFEVVTAVGGKVDLRLAMNQALTWQKIVSLPEFDLGERALQIDVEPVRDRFSYLLGVAIVFHDVTQRKQLERLREEFTAMMVHELRTPLTTISYSTDMMTSDLPHLRPEDISSNLGIIKSTTDNMLSLVTELLDVAKIEAGKFVVTRKEGNLTQFLTDKIAALQSLAQAKKLSLLSVIDPNLTKVNFDPNRIGQVVNNLISNAIKYTDSGWVKLEAKVNQGRVEVSVSDNGEGIAQEDIPKLFSKFEQLGKGKTGEKGGTGLGLVVTKGIVEAHEGKVWVTSAGKGQGTTFTFTIPL